MAAQQQEVRQMMSQHEFSTKLKESRSRFESINDPDHVLSLPYPQDCIQWNDNGMIIAAGGGGATRSGVASGFEILQFIKMDNNKFELKRHSWYNTGPDKVYCIRQHPIYRYQFIAGIGNNLVIMEISSYSKPAENNAFEYDWNNISKIQYPMNNTIIRAPINTIYIKPNIESTKLPDPEAPFSVLKIDVSSSGKLIACGGTDGIVRLFQYDFVDPNNGLCFNQQINITHQHYKQLGKERNSNEAPPEILGLLFDRFNDKKESKYLSITNRSFAAYIWNINKNKMETILMEKRSSTSYIFRDCAFIDDGTNKYCICAVNTVRKSKRSINTPSYLYQYYIPPNDDDDNDDDWYRINYCKITKSQVMRMIADIKTRNIITLHLDGMVCIFDGLNLNKLYSFKNDGRFFIDIAISPNLYGNKENNYTEYLLIVLMNDLLIKPISLKSCYGKGGVNRSNFCSFKCFTWFVSIIIVIVGILIGMVQQNTLQYASATFN